MSVHIIILVASFALVWFSAGLVVDSIASIARRLNLTPFSFSFFFLGLFTSITELMIGLNALWKDEPTIFVGNLLGGTIVLFGLILPLLAIMSNGIRFKKEVTSIQLGVILLYVCIPALAVSDGSVSILEATLLVLGYPLLWLLIKIRHQSVLATMFYQLTRTRGSIPNKSRQMLLGIGLLVMAGYFLVQQTLWLSTAFGTTPFLISLLMLSVGSNIPELVVAIRAALNGKTEVAYGSYLGSGVANAFFFGLFTLLQQQAIPVPHGVTLLFPTIIFLIVLFFFFLRSNKGLSRLEGLLLLAIYFLYVTGEWMFGS